MQPSIYIDCRTYSDTTSREPDIVVLDVGRRESVALIRVSIPDGDGELPWSQFVEREVERLSHEAAFETAFQQGDVDLQLAVAAKDIPYTKAEVIAELLQASNVPDAFSEHARDAQTASCPSYDYAKKPRRAG